MEMQPKDIKNLEEYAAVSNLLNENMFYALKTLRTVYESWYLGLQQRDSDSGWVEADPEYGDDPYYVCAAFDNGSHIPLPLIMGDQSEFPLQDLVLEQARRTGKLAKIVNDCEEYIIAVGGGSSYAAEEVEFLKVERMFFFLNSLVEEEQLFDPRSELDRLLMEA